MYTCVHLVGGADKAGGLFCSALCSQRPQLTLISSCSIPGSVDKDDLVANLKHLRANPQNNTSGRGFWKNVKKLHKSQIFDGTVQIDLNFCISQIQNCLPAVSIIYKCITITRGDLNLNYIESVGLVTKVYL